MIKENDILTTTTIGNILMRRLQKYKADGTITSSEFVTMIGEIESKLHYYRQILDMEKVYVNLPSLGQRKRVYPLGYVEKDGEVELAFCVRKNGGLFSAPVECVIC